MATFTADTDLRLRVGSNTDQAGADRELRTLLRSAVSEAVALLPALAPEGETAPTVAEIQTMSTAQAKRWMQRLVRGYVRDLALAYDTKAADAQHVAPVRSRADKTEDAG